MGRVRERRAAVRIRKKGRKKRQRRRAKDAIRFYDKSKAGFGHHPDLCSSQETPPLLREKFEKGELGVKTGKGFYDYSGGRGEEAIRERDEKFIRLYRALYRK